MSKIEVNAVEPQCGTTLTLGAAGDTVTLGSGASQSGFGRTGTVDWQTGSIKTSNFTAADGEGYFVNTTSGAVTMSLPAGSAGAIVSVQDYNNTFDSNALTVSPDGSEKINGGAGGIILTTEGQGLTLVYIDATVGWRAIQDGDFSNPGSNFIVASGGTETECGDYKIHTFTGPGTFTVTAAAASSPDNVLEYLVVAGGGGGGGQAGNTRGGAGAGGFRFAAPSLAPLTYPAKPLAAPAGLTASVQSYPITVGSGGAGSCAGADGANSVFSTITSAGGGRASATGGSGGGANGGAIDAPGPAGNTPPVSPAQGRPGGNSSQQQPDHGSGGGGGAMADGSDGRGPACTGRSGPGGAGGGLPAGFGANGQPCGSFRYYAGGGGGGGHPPVSLNAGVGGLGGGASGSSSTGSNATANTGGGAGSGGPAANGGNGGSGIVVIRYKFQ